MTYKAVVETAAVAATAPVTLATAGIPATVVSVTIGLIGVWLARTVFVNRENRRLQQPHSFSENLPITLAGCLIAGAVIWDRQLGISASAFTGLGIGWSTVLLLEIFGDRILNALRGAAGVQPLAPPQGLGAEREPPAHYPAPSPKPIHPSQAVDVFPVVPEDMSQLVEKIDEVAPDYTPPKPRPRRR